jgi:hypothetical protein
MTSGQPRVVEGRPGRVLASIMRAYPAWHRKRRLLAARLRER